MDPFYSDWRCFLTHDHAPLSQAQMNKAFYVGHCFLMAGDTLMYSHRVVITQLNQHRTYLRGMATFIVGFNCGNLGLYFLAFICSYVCAHEPVISYVMTSVVLMHYGACSHLYNSLPWQHICYKQQAVNGKY